MTALDNIVRQGKVRDIGVSNLRLAQIEECMRLRRVDVVQYAWKHVRPAHAGPDLPLLRAREGIGVMAYGSLAYGMLSGTFHIGMQFEENDWRAKGGMCSAISTCSARSSDRNISPAIPQRLTT